MSRRSNPPQGRTDNHDHSRSGEGGDDLNPDAIGLTGDEPFDFGDIQVEFRPGVGANGALVFRDTANGVDRFELRIADALRLLAQNLDLTGESIDNIGGTPAANAGALRLANAVALNWRSSEDDGDFGWRLDAAENMVYAADGTDRAQFGENGSLDIEGTLTEGASL